MTKTKSIKVRFMNSRGYFLDGRLETPVNQPITDYLIFSHCFTCSKDILTAYRSSRLLARAGYGVLRFDFSGLGDSEGDFSTTNFTSTVDDLRSAIAFLQEQHRPPGILIGHSLGGTTSLATAVNADCIKRVVTIASPSQPAHVLHHFGAALTLLEQNIPASFEVAGQFYDIEPQFVEDVRRWDMQKTLRQLHKPTLLFSVKDDPLVAEKNAEQLHQWCAGESRIIHLQHTDHLISDKSSHEAMIDAIVQWLQKT